jgi:hypothetical protein
MVTLPSPFNRQGPEIIKVGVPPPLEEATGVNDPPYTAVLFVRLGAVSETTGFCSGATEKLTSTGGAAPYAVCPGFAVVPGWVASTVQVPVIKKLAVEPETVHTLVVLLVKVTGSPEVAEATKFNVPPTNCVPGVLKVMV